MKIKNQIEIRINFKEREKKDENFELLF